MRRAPRWSGKRAARRRRARRPGRDTHSAPAVPSRGRPAAKPGDVPYGPPPRHPARPQRNAHPPDPPEGRIAPDVPAFELPEPEARLRILEAILDYPGLHIRGIARETGIGASLVEYHANQLLDADLVTESLHDGYRRFYPRPGPAAPPIDDAPVLALLRENAPLHIALLLLTSQTPLTHAALTEMLGLAKSTTTFHLDKLREAGLVESQGHAPIRVKDPRRLAALLVRHRPVPALMDRHFALWLALYKQWGAVTNPLGGTPGSG